MRVCCFCECWESGGIESFLNNILSHMDLSDIEVDIVATCLKKSVFTSSLEDKGIHFYELSGNQRKLLKNNKMFRALLRERNYDVVHFNLFQGLSLRFVRIAKQEGVPVRIAHSHNTALRKSKTRWAKMLLHRMGSFLYSDNATEFWACSEAAAKFLFPAKSLANKSFHFIPNGIEIDRFQFNEANRNTIRAQHGLTHHFVIGNIGRLCYQKNQDFLLDVFAVVSACNPNCRLLLAGEGDMEDYLVSKVERLHIADKVIFFGLTDHPEYLYSAMDMFAFPSLFEGLGIVAVEAQAAGLPVVCSEHIPQEAYVTPHIKMVELSKGAAHWAQELLDCTRPLRSKGSEMVRAANFDIIDVAQMVRKGYCGIKSE